jgi:carbonic anhydrase
MSQPQFHMKRALFLFLLLFMAVGVSPLLNAFAAPAQKATPPASVMKHLKEGNRHFESGHPLHPHEDPRLRKKLEKGQHPEAIVVACSDSRVSPELIFDEGLGDLFVIRTAGNVLDSNGLASVEYGISVLGTRVLVLMGHDYCGAIEKSLHLRGDVPEKPQVHESTKKGKPLSPHLQGLVSQIQKNLRREASQPVLNHGGDRFHAEAIQNVNAEAARWLEESTVIQSAVRSGQLKIVRALYDMRSGHVTFLEDAEAKPKK